MHQIRFLLGLRPISRWGANSAPPDPLAGFKAPTSKERERRKNGMKGQGKGKGPTFKARGRGGKGRRGLASQT